MQRCRNKVEVKPAPPGLPGRAEIKKKLKMENAIREIKKVLPTGEDLGGAYFSICSITALVTPVNENPPS